MKKISKQYKRRIIFFGSISLFTIVSFIYSIISYTSSIVSLEKEQSNLQNELIELQKENTDLRVEIEKLKDPEYLAKYARENFLYSKNGEYVIKIDENIKSLENEIENVNNNEKIVFLLGALLIVLIIYISIKIRKNRK